MNVEVDKLAKAYSKQEITINASAEKVYSILSSINDVDKKHA